MRLSDFIYPHTLTLDNSGPPQTAERPARGAAMSVAPAPAPAPASRLQLEVGVALRPEPDPTGVLSFKPKPNAETKPQLSAQATTVAAFLERLWYNQASGEEGRDERRAGRPVRGRPCRRRSRRQTMDASKCPAAWRQTTTRCYGSPCPPRQATPTGVMIDVQRIGMRLWADLNTPREASVVLGRLVACNWWWPPRSPNWRPSRTRPRREARGRLRELHDILPFRGQYKIKNLATSTLPSRR